MTLAANDLAFGHRGIALGHVADLAIAEGEVLCLLGPNGSGKTTLLKTLLGLLPPIGGTVRWNGALLGSLSERAIARLVGYVPQAGPPTFPFTALEIVLMGRAARVGLFASPSKGDRESAAAALDSLGVGRLASRLFTELSGGERQMVLIARALAQEPAILVMDEPTASLDFGNQAEVLETIASVAARGLSVVFSTHDPDHALAVASRVALLREGRMIAVGTLSETVTPELMKRLYDVDVAVAYLAAIGRNTCVPFPRTANARPPTEGRPS